MIRRHISAMPKGEKLPRVLQSIPSACKRIVHHHYHMFQHLPLGFADARPKTRLNRKLAKPMRDLWPTRSVSVVLAWIVEERHWSMLNADGASLRAMTQRRSWSMWKIREITVQLHIWYAVYLLLRFLYKYAYTPRDRTQRWVGMVERLQVVESMFSPCSDCHS
jgi:hypothetical protein